MVKLDRLPHHVKLDSCSHDVATWASDRPSPAERPLTALDAFGAAPYA
jgi:hypothetical protein